jgi:hypothetical protein
MERDHISAQSDFLWVLLYGFLPRKSFEHQILRFEETVKYGVREKPARSGQAFLPYQLLIRIDLGNGYKIVENKIKAVKN